MQQSTQHCARRAGLTAFSSPKGILYKNPKCRLTVGYHRPDETIIYKIGLHQSIPPVFTFASFALNHCTRFVEKLCPMLPFNYDAMKKTLYSLSLVEMAQL